MKIVVKKEGTSVTTRCDPQEADHGSKWARYKCGWRR
jgi:hypothetical protein